MGCIFCSICKEHHLLCMNFCYDKLYFLNFVLLLIFSKLLHWSSYLLLPLYVSGNLEISSDQHNYIPFRYQQYGRVHIKVVNGNRVFTDLQKVWYDYCWCTVWSIFFFLLCLFEWFDTIHLFDSFISMLYIKFKQIINNWMIMRSLDDVFIFPSWFFTMQFQGTFRF